ncbi:hypothetical protein BDR07DRAFT_1381144 [Suillus spraguei]|nr:hypothetical protein BDR07DRAFT_1381144 [Suillus spraguei]
MTKTDRLLANFLISSYTNLGTLNILRQQKRGIIGTMRRIGANAALPGATMNYRMKFVYLENAKPGLLQAQTNTTHLRILVIACARAIKTRYQSAVLILEVFVTAQLAAAENDDDKLVGLALAVLAAHHRQK